MNKVRLGEICTFQSGGTPSKKIDEYYNGTIPWITTVALNGKRIDETSAIEWITDRALTESAAKRVPADSIMVGIRVGVGKVAINTVEMSTNQDIISLLNIDDSIWNKDFLCKFIQSKSNYLNAQARGATIKGIKIDVLSSLELPDMSISIQKRVSKVLDALSSVIDKSYSQIDILDKLIKSRFVEMFGTVNLSIFPRHAMTDLCEIIDGDRGKNYPKQDEFFEYGYCLFLNAKNVTSKGFDFSQCMFITQQKDDQLRKGKLKRGDVVLTTRGTIGNLAYFSKDIPFEHMRINSGMVILRMKKELINEVFFIEHFKIILSDILQTVASGSAQPQLPINTMKNIKLITPPLDLQNKFADFVTQVEKQKATVQQSIDKLETLKKSLMQEYFG